jgi:hypothetical protein
MRHKPYTEVYRKKKDYPQVQHIHPLRQTLVVLPQIQCHWVIVDISGTCSQSINIYMIVVVATFA